ncbi:unnamed protein product [Mucor hiemalis]
MNAVVTFNQQRSKNVNNIISYNYGSVKSGKRKYKKTDQSSEESEEDEDEVEHGEEVEEGGEKDGEVEDGGERRNSHGMDFLVGVGPKVNVEGRDDNWVVNGLNISKKIP